MDRMRSLVTLFVVSLTLTVGASAASAQMTQLLDAKVPFAFRAGGALLPAGEYSIMQDTGDLSMFLVESKDGRHSVWVFTTGEKPTGQTPKASELVFARYGNEYYLQDFWAFENGFMLVRTPHQAKIARAHKSAPEQVHVRAGAKKS